MSFPILTSLVALPVAGAILLLFVNGDEERSAPLARNIARYSPALRCTCIG